MVARLKPTVALKAVLLKAVYLKELAGEHHKGCGVRFN